MAEENNQEEIKKEASAEDQSSDQNVSSESEENKSEEVNIPDKFKDLVEQIEKLSVLELSELVKVLEKKFGVSATAPVVATAAGTMATGGEEEDKEDEKATVDIELKLAGDQKIQVIKIIKELSGLGLREAKAVVDEAPKVIKEGVDRKEAEEIKSKLEAVGATVELK